ncbi:MAG: hypothetical protein IT443_00580 [Phycisphaeraceae bacterium]|nr:hypothetical protein [Phycisphaeraceae bacterium]
MITYHLDNQPIDTTSANLDELLQHAGDRLAAQGRMVVEITINGQVLEAEEIDERRPQGVEGLEIRLLSADPQELITLMLQQARDELAEAGELQNEAAAMLQRDETAGAMVKIGAAIRVWQQVPQVLMQVVRFAEVDLDDLLVDEIPATQLIQGLLLQLQQLRQAIMGSDTVALADALAYEWPQTVERWDQLMVVLGEWLTEDHAAEPGKGE